MNDVDRSARPPYQSPLITGFKIIREIGRGGMGVVYETEEELLSRRVALKLLPASALHHPKQVERFRREAKAAARLHHTNIVPVFGVGEQAGHPYYVMQYIDGRGLDEVLKELRLLRQDGSSPRPVAVIQPLDGQAPLGGFDGHDVQGPRSINAAHLALSLASGRFEGPGSPTAEGQRTEAGASETATLAPPIISANHAPAGASSLVLTGFSKLSSQSDLGRPYFQTVARIGLQVAEALEHANRQGVLHRDIKPSNLLVDSEGSVRVTDFGVAKMADSDDLTDTGDLVGTPRYMAPERFRCQCDVRSDVYGLGPTLYELVALRPAYEASDRHELIEKVLHEEPLRLNTLAPSIPRDLDTIIQKAIAREPARRYATAAALADDLRRFLEGRPIAARPVGAGERLWRWCRRNPKLATVTTLLAATVLIAVSTFVGLTYRHNIQLRAEVKRTEDQAAEAGRNAAEARRNYQEARKALQAMLAKLNDGRLAGSPRLIELRRDLQQEALAFYDQILLQNDSKDPLVRADTARALLDAYVLQHVLGRGKDAEKSVRRAVRLVEGLRSEQPDDIGYMALQVDCLLRLAVCMHDLKQRDQNIDINRQAVGLAERVAKVMPHDLAHQERLATCHLNYGGDLLAVKKTREAMDHFREAAKICKGIDHSKLPGVTLRLAQSLMNEGVIFFFYDRNPSEAAKRFQEADRVLQSIPPDHRDEGGNSVIALGRIHENWGGMLYSLKRFDESVARSDVGLKQVEPYLLIEPNDAEAREVCLKLHGNRGMALSELGKHPESAEDWTRVVELSTQPVPSSYRIQLAVELVWAGQLDQALKQAKLMQPASDMSGSDLYNVGCLFSLGAAAAQKDARVSPDKRRKLVESYTSDSLRWLKAAFDAGFFRDPTNRDNAKKDPDLEILRDHPKFRQLIEPPAAKPANKGK